MKLLARLLRRGPERPRAHIYAPDQWEEELLREDRGQLELPLRRATLKLDDMGMDDGT